MVGRPAPNAKLRPCLNVCLGVAIVLDQTMSEDLEGVFLGSEPHVRATAEKDHLFRNWWTDQNG